MRRWLVWPIVLAVAALIAHACGYVFGIGNQATYLLQALHRAHPELLRNDWLVTSTAEYHSLFSALGGLLFRIDDNGAAFAILNFLLMVTLLVGLFLVVRAATTRAALPIFLLVVGWLTVNGERSIAGSYLWSGYLQPSLLATAAWLIALALHVRGRPLATGIALAAGGLFHANFLVLGIGMFALVELVAERDARLRRIALLLAPQLLALALLAPEIFAHARGDAEGALWVLVQFHAPVHYKPSSIVFSLPSLLRWLALALVVAPVAVEYGQRAPVRRLVWWSGIASSLCAVSALAMMLIPALLPLTRLYVWRLAPFAVLATQLVIAIAAAATITDLRCWRAQPLWRRVCAVGLVLWIAAATPFMQAAAADWLLFITIAAIAISVVAPVRWRPGILSVTAVATLAAPLWYRRDELLHPDVGVEAHRRDEDALYAWARSSTSTEAVFMTSPTLARFRLIARRAVYADFKSPPLAPAGLVEWHARLCRMTGALPTEKIPAHLERWLAATGDDIFARAQQLGVDYLVLDRTPAHDRIAVEPVYANASFSVFAVR